MRAGEVEAWTTGLRRVAGVHKAVPQADSQDIPDFPLSPLHQTQVFHQALPHTETPTTTANGTLLQAKWRAVGSCSHPAQGGLCLPLDIAEILQEKGGREGVMLPSRAGPVWLSSLVCTCFASPLQRVKHPACHFQPPPAGLTIRENPGGVTSHPHGAPTHPQLQSARSQPPSRARCGQCGLWRSPGLVPQQHPEPRDIVREGSGVKRVLWGGPGRSEPRWPFS